jgi:hypothetical protein
LASVLDVTIAIVLAWRGWFMMPLPVLLLVSMLVCATGFTFILNLLKIPVFKRLQISSTLSTEGGLPKSQIVWAPEKAHVVT